MKFSLLVLLSVFLAYGLSVYGGNNNRLNNNSDVVLTCDVNPTVSDSFIDLFAFEPAKETPKMELFFSVRRKSNHRITKKELEKVTRLDDMVENYPDSWITEYRLVELTSYHNKNEKTARGEDDVLTPEQLTLIQSVEINDEIQVMVNFKSENIITKNLEDRELIVNITVAPFKEAEYSEGYENLIAYFIVNSKGKVPANIINEMDPSTISFVVNEKGEAENIEVTNSCGDSDVDHLFVDLLKNMPAWEPAEDEAGNKVKQQLQFNFGLDGC